MFVKESASESDKEIYEKISRHRWDKRYNNWIVDRQKDIYIVDTGKRGVETPVIFNMLFDRIKLQFWIWENEYRYNIIDVSIPQELNDYKAEIEDAIRYAYSETNGLSNLWSLPSNIDEYTFRFKID